MKRHELGSRLRAWSGQSISMSLVTGMRPKQSKAEKQQNKSLKARAYSHQRQGQTCRKSQTGAMKPGMKDG